MLVAPSTNSEALIGKIQVLSPKDDTQRPLQAEALSTVAGLLQTRWLMYEQGTDSVSRTMLAILVFWLATTLSASGSSRLRNAPVITALFVAGLPVSCAIFLILEMYAPFGG